MPRLSTILVIALLSNCQYGGPKSQPTGQSADSHGQAVLPTLEPTKPNCDFSRFKALKMHSLPAEKLPKPVYPPEAEEQKVSGTVVVKVIVDKQGTVTVACAVEGDDRLRKAAEEAAMQAKFEPGLWNSYNAERYDYAEFAVSYHFVR
jgi:TonB family protein